VRPRDPRRLLERRRRARARVQIVPARRSEYADDGSIGSRQEAAVTLPRAELDRVWSPEFLERLARTYWRFLSRRFLGLLRVVYSESSREVVLLRKPFVLLRFHAPEYHLEEHGGTVTWPIEQGLLVAPPGRGRGYLRLSVQRPPDDDGKSPEITARVSSEVVNFYPAIAGRGWFARLGRQIYNQTQLRIHVLVTHSFLRSLANLELAPSLVGALRPVGDAEGRIEVSPAARR
jgi:hypothetical protein